MTGNVLIIEDEQELAELVQLYLNKEGLKTSWADSAEKGLELLTGESFDLIILDINLPGMDGFEFLQKFRRDHTNPVIIVSAREADEDVIMGLGVGADEFVIKPFAPRVLTARVRALLRRSKQFTGDQRTVYSFDSFTLDYEGYVLKQGEKPVAISTREFEVLRYLVKNAGTVFTPDQIYEAVWEQEFGDITAVAVYIQRIRKKIDTGDISLIKTIHGKGYRFEKDRLI
jgi:two-component system response regulator RegX3